MLLVSAAPVQVVALRVGDLVRTLQRLLEHALLLILHLLLALQPLAVQVLSPQARCASNHPVNPASPVSGPCVREVVRWLRALQACRRLRVSAGHDGVARVRGRWIIIMTHACTRNSQHFAREDASHAVREQFDRARGGGEAARRRKMPQESIGRAGELLMRTVRRRTGATEALAAEVESSLRAEKTGRHLTTLRVQDCTRNLWSCTRPGTMRQNWRAFEPGRIQREDLLLYASVHGQEWQAVCFTKGARAESIPQLTERRMHSCSGSKIALATHFPTFR